MSSSSDFSEPAMRVSSGTHGAPGKRAPAPETPECKRQRSSHEAFYGDAGERMPPRTRPASKTAEDLVHILLDMEAVIEACEKQEVGEIHVKFREMCYLVREAITKH